MSQYDYDLFVIGGGSGGVRAARMSATYGARVALAEERALGGTCVNVGCIPKKLMVYASHFHDHFDDAAGFGWSLGARRFDWPTLVANKDREITRLNEAYQQLLEHAGVQLMTGRACIVDAHTVSVGGRRHTAEYILVAIGSWPFVPPILGREHAVTSNEMFHLPALPPRVIVVGGGYIAVEFASILHGLGAEVIQLCRGPLFLRGFDDDVRAALAVQMAKRGVGLRFDVHVQSLARVGGCVRAALSDGAALDADLALYATGRLPNTAGLGLEDVGVTMKENGAVVVDLYSRSSVASIFAVGDCTDRLNLTPVAIVEGQAVAETLFRDTPTCVDYANVPTAVFSIPGIGSVGLTEQVARARGHDVEIYKTTFRPLLHTLSGRDEQTFMKLVVARDTGRVLGCHMVGADAGEIIQGFAVAIHCGATKLQLDQTIGIHPTAAEELVTMRTKAPESTEHVEVTAQAAIKKILAEGVKPRWGVTPTSS